MPDTSAAEPEWFTADELAARLKTTRRTILRWVAEKRIPAPQKFGKLARWSAAVLADIDAKGVTGQPVARAEFNRLPPEGLKVTCPCCAAELRVTRGGTAEAVNPPARGDAGAGPEPARRGKKK